MSDMNGIAVIYALVTGYIAGISTSWLLYALFMWNQRRIERRMQAVTQEWKNGTKKWGVN